MNILYKFKNVFITATLMTFCLKLSFAAPPAYTAAIQEGQNAAQTTIDQQGASAITIALVDTDHIIWSQSFGVADPLTGQAPSDSTMFGIGSVSKMFAAIAVMKLVEQGIIDLDTPLVTYLPDFKMASPEYKNITVRMLLNHSSGFPGTDYRNASIRARVPGYFKQVLQTLSVARLKAPPGYMSVYCNDGFTVIEALIKAKTGKPYAQFVQDEIFTPLNMQNSHYPTTAFPAGSYAKASANGVVKPQEFLNAMASGGVYSTANDMANIAMLFLGKGTKGSVRILSDTSIDKMAVDQTLGSFNPVRSTAWAYGLGWDSVSQPGLLAVGFNGWTKGGDSSDYGATLIVSPQAGLGVVVIGASGFGSGQATAIGERILLRALAENGKIASFPTPLTSAVPQTSSNTPLQALDGDYASASFILRFLTNPQAETQASILASNGFVPSGPPLTYAHDGWFASALDPLKAFKVISSDLQGKQTDYIVKSAPVGYGHYLDTTVFAQKINGNVAGISPVWRSRLPLTWLVVNAHPDELIWNGMDPRLRLSSIPNLPGLIAVSPPTEAAQFHILDPSQSDTEARMMLIIPQLDGRDLNDLVFVKQNCEEWARLGSYRHRPLVSVPVLKPNSLQRITIDSSGYAEWRSIPVSDKSVQLGLSTKTNNSWHLYDATFQSIAHGKGDKQVILPAGQGPGYLILYGDPGNTIKITTKIK